MPNSLFGPAPAQIPRNADLGELARLNMLPFRKLIFTASQTWSPSRPVLANIYVTGGGGSPASNTAAHDGSTGGGGGGTAIKFGVLLLPTVVYTLVIGAGGAQAAASMNGNPGANSSFSGNGLTLVGGGGMAGNALRQNISSAGAFSQAYGGTATGGDINMRGGCGQAYMGVSPQSVGTAIVGGSTSPIVIAGPGGASFWGPGGPATMAPSNYGEGAAGTGVNGLSQGNAGFQGVIMIEFND